MVLHGGFGTTLRFGHVKIFGIDCDVTKDSLRRFNGARLSFRRAAPGAGNNNLPEMRNHQQSCAARAAHPAMEPIND
jgi:hypothetical protein